MIVKSAHLVCFSPTHTSRKVAEAIVGGLGMETVEEVDLTLQDIDNQEIPSDSLAVIAVPVYGGKVAPLAMKRLQALRGNQTPAVLIVVYGNRAYEQALMELDAYATRAGFKVIGGATFVGEHSYSTARTPIAAGRPDADDLALAADFGLSLREKIEQAADAEHLYPVDVRAITRPAQPFFPLLRFLFKVMRLRKSGAPMPRTPQTNAAQCTHCGVCATVCPSGAIEPGKEEVTDPEKCIKCCACVKSCARGARVYETPFADLLATCFQKQKKPQTQL